MTTTEAVDAGPEVIYDSTDRGIDGAETSQSATETAELPAISCHPVSSKSAATVNGIGWQGVYCDQVEDAPAPDPHATDFLIGLHSDRDGMPDTADPLWSETIEAAAAKAITPSFRTYWGWRGALGAESTFQAFNGQLKEVTHPRSVALLP